MLAWSSVSTAIDDPEIGVQTLHAVHDIGARWLAAAEDEDEEVEGEGLPIVYPDTAWSCLFDVVEALAVVSSESMQHQVYTTALEVLCLLFHDLSPALRERAIDVIRRVLAAAGDFVLARELELALAQTVETLRAYGYDGAADEVARAGGAGEECGRAGEPVNAGAGSELAPPWVTVIGDVSLYSSSLRSSSWLWVSKVT